MQIDILAEADRMWTVNPKHHRLVVNHHLCLILHGTTSRTINDIEPDSARKAVEAKKDKVAQAINQATGAIAQAEIVDTETGEIIQPATETSSAKSETKETKTSKQPSK